MSGGGGGGGGSGGGIAAAVGVLTVAGVAVLNSGLLVRLAHRLFVSHSMRLNASPLDWLLAGACARGARRGRCFAECGRGGG